MVDLTNKISTVLREYYGNFDTELELQYEEKLVNSIKLLDFDKKREWATYNQVVLELKHSLKQHQLVKELQYRLSDKENPREVCLEVIAGVENLSPELVRLHTKITSFVD